jgi:selenocysteine-specific elongation factor
VRLRVLGPSALLPGDTGTIRLHMGERIPLLPGDRFVLREFGRDETVGGGVVLDVSPMLPASKAVPDRSVQRVVRERKWTDADELFLLTGEQLDANLGRWVVDPEVLSAHLQAVHDLIESAGDHGIDVASFDERQRIALDQFEDVTVEQGLARLIGTADVFSDHPYVAAINAAPFSPPDPDDVPADELRGLVQRNQILHIDGRYFTPSAIEAAAHEIARMLASHPDGVTVSEVREHLGNTRKNALPLLGHLDATGVTRRRGDVRVAGPRLPSVG